MTVVFVHGWGVRTPDYGPLPQRLRELAGAATLDVWLSDYISYSDSVTMTDLALAFERARQAAFPVTPFACVTHSTGGPVLRTWLDLLYRDRDYPLTHLIMLAPPNHGSALAQLGKSRIARMALWFGGREPGERILDWLELGSPEAWDLNLRWARSNWAARGVRCFVLTGTHVDRKLYDHLNSYTGERGSDGVVRAASANLNYSVLRLRQAAGGFETVEKLETEPNFFALLPDASHTGIRSGIMRSANAAARIASLLTEPIPAHSGPETAQNHSKCSILTLRVVDSAGAPVEDFDLLLTAGPHYSPDDLPRGFFIDRQRNSKARNMLTYYFDHAALSQARQLGFRVTARPSSGPVRFTSAEYRGENIFRPHQTLMLEVSLSRRLEDRVFRVTATPTLAAG
jgi:pimeloyl-ACP methyl ester carboxylesterase